MLLYQESGYVGIYFDVQWDVHMPIASCKSILHLQGDGSVLVITENELKEVLNSEILDQMKSKAIEEFLYNSSGAV